MLHQVADRDRAFLQAACLEARAVRGVDAQLERVLNGHDPLVGGQQFDEGIQQRGLAAAGAAAHEDVAPRVEGPLGGGADVFGQRALLDQLRRRKGAFTEPPHGGSRTS